MNRTEYRQILKMDRARYPKEKSFIFLYLFSDAFRLVFQYRRLNYFKDHRVFKVFYPFERFMYHRTCRRCGCDIPSHVTIAGGWKIIHTWGIVMNSKTIAGENFTILSGTVIGVNHTGVPKFGNNVYLGAHSIVIGGVLIDDNSEIGAGAIVTHDVPKNAVVIGNNAHVHRIKNIE